MHPKAEGVSCTKSAILSGVDFSAPYDSGGFRLDGPILEVCPQPRESESEDDDLIHLRAYLLTSREGGKYARLAREDMV